MSLRIFAAVGEHEQHWVVANDQADAEALLAEWIEGSGAKEEYAEQLADCPWSWSEFAPNDILTQFEDDDSQETRTASEWIASEGRGHLSVGEIG